MGILKVLYVEDKKAFHRWNKEILADETDKVELISAFSINEAREKFRETPNLAAIAVDACVPGSDPNTMALVQWFRETFPGPMIAVSCVEMYREKLMEAGCDFESDKEPLPEKILEVLGL